MKNLNTSIRTQFTDEHLPLSFYVKHYNDLPDGLMKTHGISFSANGSDKDTKFFNLIKKSYRATASWVFYYFGYPALKEELIFTEKSFYKPLGEICKAWITIIQETFLLSPELQEVWKNPAAFWMLIETEKCEKLFAKSGFTGIASPTGKGERYSGIIDACIFLGDSNNLQVKPVITDSPSQWFYGHALELCAIPDNVQYRTKWNQFLRTLKRCERDLERSPLKVTFLQDGQLKQLQQGRKKEI